MYSYAHMGNNNNHVPSHERYIIVVNVIWLFTQLAMIHMTNMN